MKFTIIVPMYNVEMYIGECIESVLNQTYGDFELILIDDESIDRTVDVAKEYQNKDDRIVLLTKKHGGLPQTRNYGLRIAKGEYVILLDGDDYFSLDHLQKAKAVVEKYNCDMCIGNNHINFAKDYQRKIVLFLYDDSINQMGLEEKISFIFDRQNLLPANAVLTIYKREFLVENDISYGEQYTCSEDLDFFMHSISKVKSICFFGHDFYYYRQDNSNAMTKNMTALMFQSRLDIYKKWYDYFMSMADEVKYCEDICNALRRGIEANINLIGTLKLSGKNKLKKFIRDNDYLWIYPKNKLNNYYTQYYFIRPINKQKRRFFIMLSSVKNIFLNIGKI